MLLMKIDVNDIYKWFMEMFIDSYEWVMIPNIYGMSQYNSDIMMTRPYFSSSNYICKMSSYKKNKYEKINIDNNEYYWNEIWDTLYYSFINDYKNILKNNYAFANAVNNWSKFKPDKKKEILHIANLFIDHY